MMQQAVRDLVALGTVLTDDMPYETLVAAQELVGQLDSPLNEDDIRALMTVLPADGDTTMGIVWPILHAIEASPAWPIWDVLVDMDHEWISIFVIRLANAGEHRPVRMPE